MDPYATHKPHEGMGNPQVATIINEMMNGLMMFARPFLTLICFLMRTAIHSENM